MGAHELRSVAPRRREGAPGAPEAHARMRKGAKKLRKSARAENPTGSIKSHCLKRKPIQMGLPFQMGLPLSQWDPI